MGGRSPEPAPTALQHPQSPPPSFPRPSPVTSAPFPSFLRPPSRHSCAGRNPHFPSTVLPSYRRTKVRAMPTSPNTDQPRAQTAAPHAAASLRTTPNNPEQIRTNPNTAKRPDQIGPHPESPPTPRKKRKPEQRPERSTPLHAQTAAPHAAASLRTTPNKLEHRRTPRPDRTTPRITPSTPKKRKPEQRAQRSTPPRGRCLTRASWLRSML